MMYNDYVRLSIILVVSLLQETMNNTTYMINVIVMYYPFLKREKRIMYILKKKGGLTLRLCITPTDSIEGKRLKAYLAQTGQSANSYIKGLIKANLDAKGLRCWKIRNEKTMDAKKVINQLLLERHTDINGLSEKLGIKSQSLRNKISRGNYSLNDSLK